MSIAIYWEDSECVALDSETDVAGYGETEAEARANLDTEHRELHDRLRELGPDRLGKHLAAVLEVLERRAREGA